MKDKALLPSPTPASKTRSAEELLWLSFIFNMATLFLIFAVLLINRYFTEREKLPEFNNKIGNRPKEKRRISPQKKEQLEEFDNVASDESKESDSEKRESLQKPNHFNSPYGTFLKRAECSQYMMLFQKYSESLPDKPLYTIAFYTPTLHYSAFESVYTLSPCKSTVISAQAIARERPNYSQFSFFDGNTQSAIKSPSPVSDSGENISQSDSSNALNDSQQIWTLSPSPISGSNQNTPQYTASGSEQTLSKWLLSPSANVNGQDISKWILSPQGKSREGSDLYSIDDPHLSVPIPTNTPFIIELKTIPIPSEEAMAFGYGIHGL